MKDLTKKVLVVLNVRKESQRVPNKVLAPFAETNLIEIALNKVLSSKIIPGEDVLFCFDKKFEDDYTSTLHNVIINEKNKDSFKLYKRSEASCYEEENQARIYEFAFKYSDIRLYDSFILINVCCPLLSIETIDAFYSTFKYSDSVGLFGVIKKQNYIWDSYKKPINLPEPGSIMNTKSESCRIYEAAHCLYGSSLESLRKNRFMGGFTDDGPELFIIPENETFDIDYPWQFEQGEILYKGLINGR